MDNTSQLVHWVLSIDFIRLLVRCQWSLR